MRGGEGKGGCSCEEKGGKRGGAESNEASSTVSLCFQLVLLMIFIASPGDHCGAGQHGA